MAAQNKTDMRFRRKKHIKKKFIGLKRHRLVVFKSLKNIYAQIVNDEIGKIVLAVSTVSKENKTKLKNGGNVVASKYIGAEIAKKALEKGIKEVMFDRNGFFYHGRIKALADSARENGLNF